MTSWADIPATVLGVDWVHGGFYFEQEGSEVTERTLLRFLCYLLLKYRVQSPHGSRHATKLWRKPRKRLDS